MSVVGTVGRNTSRRSLKPYVENALHDEQLHASAQRGYDAGRSVFEHLRAQPDVRAAARKLASDKRLQSELRVAVEEAKTVTRRATTPRARRRRKLRGTLLAAGLFALLFVGIRRAKRVEAL